MKTQSHRKEMQIVGRISLSLLKSETCAKHGLESTQSWEIYGSPSMRTFFAEGVRVELTKAFPSLLEIAAWGFALQ